MTKDELNNGISDMHDKLGELETHARKLQNQNLADIVASAKGKLHQLLGHPDLERVSNGYEDGRQGEMPFDPKAGAPAYDPNLHGTLPVAPGSDFPAQQRPADVPRQDTVGGQRASGQPFVTGMSVQGSGTAERPALGAAVAQDEQPKTFHPGDPKFTQGANQDFRSPNDVDLNADGTLKTAPNAKGASDVRDQ